MEIVIINSVPFSAAFCKASSILASSFCLLSCKYFSSFSASYLTPVSQVGTALILNLKLHKCIIKQCTPYTTSCCKTPCLRERLFFFHCWTLQPASKTVVFTQLCIISQGNFSVEIQTPKCGLCNIKQVFKSFLKTLETLEFFLNALGTCKFSHHTRGSDFGEN